MHPDSDSLTAPRSLRERGRAGFHGKIAAYLATAVLLAAGVVIVIWFLTDNTPPEFILSPEPVFNYESGPMQTALKPENVRAEQDRMLDLGNRFIGLEGYFAAQDLVKEIYAEKGLEVYELHNDLVAPVTGIRRLSIVDPETAEVLESFDDLVYPFLPNHMQPMVTPEGGLTGELVQIDEKTIRSVASLEGKIGLVDLSDEWISRNLGLVWTRYAGLGLAALVLYHPDGWEAVQTSHLSMISLYPVNYVRLMADRSIRQHVGKTVRLDIKTSFQEVVEKTFVGVMRAPVAATEAVVIHAAYDTGSDLPDKSGGGVNALNHAILVQFMRGLRSYQGSLVRDVIFVSHGSRGLWDESMTQFLAFLGPNTAVAGSANSADLGALKSKDRKLLFLERREENNLRLEQIEKILNLFRDNHFLIDAAVTENALESIDPTTRSFLEEQAEHTVKTVVEECNEPYIQARIAVKTDNIVDPEHPYIKAYNEARMAFENARSNTGYTLSSLLLTKPAFVESIGLRSRAQDRFLHLRAFHRRNNTWIAQGFALIDVFSNYRELGFFEPFLGPDHPDSNNPEVLSFNTEQRFLSQGPYGIGSLLSSSRERLGLSEAIELPEVRPTQTRNANRETPTRRGTPIRKLNWFGYPTYRFVNFNREGSYLDMYKPTVLPYMRNVDSLRASISVLGETFLSLAHGNGSLESWPVNPDAGHTYGGQVFFSSFGPSIVPDFAVEGALVGGTPANFEYVGNGLLKLPFVFTDPYGRYWLPRNTGPFPNPRHVARNGNRVSLMAVKTGDDGVIQYVQDEGSESQRMFASALVSMKDKPALANTRIVLFRAAPVTIFDIANPQSLKDFQSIKLVSAGGLAGFNKQLILSGPRVGIYTCFLEPHERFSVLFEAGSPENEQVVETRAFMLGFDDPWEFLKLNVPVGPGYIVQNEPFFVLPSDQIARSMITVNRQRLELQNAYHMADALTNDYQKKAEANFRKGSEPTAILDSRQSSLNDAVIYSMLVHPVLRSSLWEAIVAILWYLALLVPFVFFMEKLLFCNTVVNRQIMAQTVIFLSVFFLLRLLHPAFTMVRSSVMILLGFIILLICLGMTLLFSNKFNRNLEELRQRRGKLAGTESNKTGILITAFLLGLNNMHRRKVRTGLTCATLTLITFAMISFTSIQSDLVEVSTAIGKAPYQGIFLKKRFFQYLSSAEIDATKQKFGRRFNVCLRKAYVGSIVQPEFEPRKPGIEITYTEGDRSRKLELDSALDFDYRDPVQRHLRFVTEPYWFSENNRVEGEVPVLLPDRLASELGISSDQVEAGEAKVEINGASFSVRAIFEADSLANYRDLDGRDILPFDRPSVESYIPQKQASGLIPEDSPRVDPERVVILPDLDDLFSAPDGYRASFSMAVVMDDVDYRTASEAIQTHIEHIGDTVYYGLDGIAYRGRRARELSLAGMVDLLIPLIIAALTVLNTMKSSVYERRDEIYVYNSVGIAPRYIFFMFMAEASVYSIVGIIIGYLLSQATGSVFTALNFTGGLSMTYASLSTVYVSLTIAGAVFLSTLYPARQAMQIAAPTETAGWRLPEPEGEEIGFDLPFNFQNEGRFAILEFVFRLLEDHGEGGAGRFSAGKPTLAIRESDSNSPYPCLGCRIWLKPFDLGVSQDLLISVVPDRETGLHKATVNLRRVSGTREAWIRLNPGFVAQLRRHFLHWRVVTKPVRTEMFNAASIKLTEAMCEDTPPGSQTT